MRLLKLILEGIYWEGEEETLKILTQQRLIERYGIVHLEDYQSFNKLYS